MTDDVRTWSINLRSAHLQPIVKAVQNAGVSFALVPQGNVQFEIDANRPAILLIGDDLHESLGPAAFHTQSLKRFLRRCGYAVIVSSAPKLTPYAAAAGSAAAGLDVILVETRIEHEESWRTLILSERPDIPLLISTVKPQGGVH